MFYLIQADELARSWGRLVATKNQWARDSTEAVQHLEATEEAILFAVARDDLPIRNSSGAKLPASSLDDELDTFIDLQDFCDWGSKDGAKLGTPKTEFELAYNLGIHLLCEEADLNSTLMKDTHLGLPNVDKQPLRIKQILAPDNAATRRLRQLALDEPARFFTGELDHFALDSTPAMLIYAATSAADLASTTTQDSHKVRTKPIGINTTLIAQLLSSGTSNIDEDALLKRLGRSPLPIWLREVLITNGNQGKTERIWNPVLLSLALIEKCELTREQVNTIFNQSTLSEWKDGWVESAHFFKEQSD